MQNTEQFIRALLQTQCEQLQHCSIVVLPGGQINHVYRIGPAHVLKLEKELSVTAHQKQLLLKAEELCIKMPRFVKDGVFCNCAYLLMTYLPGERLTACWARISLAQKRTLMCELWAEIRQLHQISFARYSSQRPHEFESMGQAIHWQAHNCAMFGQGLAGCEGGAEQEKAQALMHFFTDNVGIVDEGAGPPVFIHNDLHFGNILVCPCEYALAGIVDLDFSRQLSREYELVRFLDFLFRPLYFMKGEEAAIAAMNWQQGIPRQEVTVIVDAIRTAYPELLSDPALIKKLKVYLVEQMLSDLEGGNGERLLARFDEIFCGNWLEETVAVLNQEI